ncbi:helix-turn-helix domain-containing protein [Streptomyces sp. NPDC046939]|uniref:helix-turn-helix domain-containing protein n=1 Tax=Streptomyces sp. NPDC046939 TaxID=3155376 RepID=UPI0033C21CD4
MATLLHALPHQYSDALATTTRPGSAPVLTVTDAITPTLAGIPLRTLQRAFRAHHGQSLMFYLRNLRLERVHADLRAEQPPGTTVAQIAGRWDFFHPSRFTAEANSADSGPLNPDGLAAGRSVSTHRGPSG